jgi:hypothetical protein
MDSMKAPPPAAGGRPAGRGAPWCARGPRAGEVRANGLAVLVLIVLAGLASGAAYYRYKQPRLAAALAAELAAAPTSAEGRVQQWERSMAPNVHHRITEVARFSGQQPWLVTHAVRRADGVLEFHGLDLASLPRNLTRAEGMSVVVELPAPRALGPGVLEGESGRYVPVYAEGEPIPDPAARLQSQVLWILDRLPEALAHDIQGARIEVRIGAPQVAPPAVR